MKKSLVIGANLSAGILATAPPAQGTGAEPLSFGPCVADGVIDPQTDFVGTRAPS